jgi:hypothetical protein
MTDSLDCRNDEGRASRQRCTNEKAWPLSEVQKEGDDRQAPAVVRGECQPQRSPLRVIGYFDESAVH